jgi:hypothetical protein
MLLKKTGRVGNIARATKKDLFSVSEKRSFCN